MFPNSFWDDVEEVKSSSELVFKVHDCDLIYDPMYKQQGNN